MYFFIKLKNKYIQYRNSRYRVAPVCNLYIGAPGSGKTTLASYFAKKDLKHGFPVFSNVPIKGTFQLDVKEDLGKYQIENARIIIDEIGTVFNNRHWKNNFNDEMLQYIKLHRHYKVAIDCFSQGLDFDNRFMGIAQNVYIVHRSLIPFFIRYKQVIKKIGIDENTKQLVDEYVYKPFGTKRIFAPLCWKMFNSFEAPQLSLKEFNKFV